MGREQPEIAPYGVEGTENGFLVIDGRNEFPAARRNQRQAAEAIARQLNGETPLPQDTDLLTQPLRPEEFGPNKESKCYFR